MGMSRMPTARNVDLIAIPDHMAWSLTSRKGLGDLTRDLLRVGLVVTLIQTRSLRSSRMMTKPYSSLKPMVGTMKKSMAAMSGAWFRKKVRHPRLGGPRRLTMYLATLDCPTSNPSLSSSP
jgi:hypothetical protein